MKNILTVSLALGLSACGSLNTVGRSDLEVAAELNKQNTNCESIPKIYSGIAYDFCYLHVKPSGLYFNWFLAFYLVDSVASAAVDTVLLPYTGYQQYKYGNTDI